MLWHIYVTKCDTAKISSRYACSIHTLRIRNYFRISLYCGEQVTITITYGLPNKKLIITKWEYYKLAFLPILLIHKIKLLRIRPSILNGLLS